MNSSALLLALLPAAAPAAASDEDLEFRLGWSAGDRVGVVERRLVGVVEHVVEYTVAVEADAAGDGLVLRREAFEYRSIGGVPVDGETPDALRAEATALGRSVPALRVRADGRPIGLAGVEAARDALVAELSGGGPPAAAALVRKRLEGEEIAGIWTEQVTRPWAHWAALWIGERFTPGSRREVHGELDVGLVEHGPLELPMNLVASEPFEQDGRRCLRLTRAAVFDEVRLGEAGVEYALLAGIPGDRLHKVTGVDSRYRAELVVELDTWRPLEARVLHTTEVEGPRVRVAQGLSRAVLEDTRYRFDWSPPEPAPDRAPPVGREEGGD